MKKLKQIITTVKTSAGVPRDEYDELLWQLICYSPKMPVRLQQEQLQNEADRFSLQVDDEYFAQKQLTFNGFSWGNGSRKILITHGWGSKAADFTELISALRRLDDLQVIAFDAPGNGSSEGELSNLLLFKQAVKAIITKYGPPDVLIGHSLGGMANIIAVQDLGIKPALVLSLTPLIRLKENFENSMDAANVPKSSQLRFLQCFEEKFGIPASYYNLTERYCLDADINHWLAYDKNDLTSTYNFMEEFLNKYPAVKNQNYEGVGHEKIIKSTQVIDDIVNRVKRTD